MTTPNPTLVFVPGYWHTPEYFTPLSTILQSVDYATVLIDLPSAGAHPGHPDFSQDVATIRSTVQNLTESGKDVVVVMHSGGSISGSEALSGISGTGKVIRVVYIGILLPKAGKTMFDTVTSIMTSPDLDPNFVKHEDEFHIIAEVCYLCLESN
jgi:pimeloyl-ACP methyl ester carboxylesterase